MKILVDIKPKSPKAVGKGVLRSYEKYIKKITVIGIFIGSAVYNF